MYTFIWIDSELKDNGTVHVIMKNYMNEAVESLRVEIKVKSKTPAKYDSFNINEDSLDEKRSEAFHHIVAKLLYVSNRARLDIALQIPFLCIRVSKSTG